MRNVMLENCDIFVMENYGKIPIDCETIVSSDVN